MMVNKKIVSKKISKMNRDADKPLKVRFCPSCRSTDVAFVFQVKNLFGLLPKVVCTRCGHDSHEFPLLVVTPRDLKKRVESMKKKKIGKKVAQKISKKNTSKKVVHKKVVRNKIKKRGKK